MICSFANHLNALFCYPGAVEATPRIYPPISTIAIPGIITASYNADTLDLTGSEMFILSFSIPLVHVTSASFDKFYVKRLLSPTVLSYFFFIPLDDAVSVVTPHMEYTSESEIALKQLHELEVLLLLVVSFFPSFLNTVANKLYLMLCTTMNFDLFRVVRNRLLWPCFQKWTFTTLDRKSVV